MPKKVKVVDTEDDARYLTIYQPFPFGGNWELESDYMQLLYWLACCTGPDALFAVLHRPRSASMVIIEVDKEFPNFDKLLGEHSWNEFLRKPSSDEVGRSSKIYYSTYSTSLQAKNDGWKRIHVESQFFDNWRPVNSKVVHPYPQPRWCDVPPENVTTKRLCRPLPTTIPRPAPFPNPKSAKQVPGASWADETEAQLFNGTGGPAHTSLSNPASGSFKPKKKKGKKGGNNTNEPATPSSPTSTPGIAWDTPIYTPDTKGSGSPPTAEIKNPTPIIPPGLTHPSFSANQSGKDEDGWGIPGQSPLQSPFTPNLADFPSPPGLVRGLTNSSTTTTSTSGSQTPNVQVTHPANPPGLSGFNSLVNEMGNVTLGGAMPGSKPGGGVYILNQYEQDEDEDGPGRYLAPYERIPVQKDDDEWSVVSGKKSAKDGKNEEQPLNYWNNQPTKKPADPDEIVCTTHGKICSKGICQTYARLKREKRIAEEQKKRMEDKKQRQKEKKRKEKEKKKEEESLRGEDSSEESDDDDDVSHGGSSFLERKRYNNSGNGKRDFGDPKPRFIDPPLRNPHPSPAWSTPPSAAKSKESPQAGPSSLAMPASNKSSNTSAWSSSRGAPSASAWGSKPGGISTTTTTTSTPNVNHNVPAKPPGIAAAAPQPRPEPAKPVQREEPMNEEKPKAQLIPSLSQYLGDDSDEDDYF